MATQPATLYHLIPQAEWEAAKSRGTTYFPPSYGADGFTHLSDDADSLVDIANHFYRGAWTIRLCVTRRFAHTASRGQRRLCPA